MHLDTSKLNEDYPPKPECEANENDCTFTPVHAMCHECGRKLCEECTVGIRHQPQMFKYTHKEGSTEDRVQLHCSDCAQSHTFNMTVLAGAGGAIVFGLLLFGLGGSIPVLLGLISLSIGGYLGYKEISLKKKLDTNEIGA